MTTIQIKNVYSLFKKSKIRTPQIKNDFSIFKKQKIKITQT